jgi:F0F1-type ATP synthase alpha subunit
MDISTRDLRRFLAELLDYLEAQKPEVLETLRTKLALDDKLKETISACVLEFKKLFRAGA